MATAREYDKCALVMGVLSTLKEGQSVILQTLEEHFGPVLEASPIMPFPYTDYYDGEMGGHPGRFLVMFKDLVDPSRLSEIKTLTNKLEQKFKTPEGGRQVNLDPGILSWANLILATCKDRSHRIPLQNGIYAETTLIYQNKDFQRLPWTYADYSSDEVKQILCHFRELYKDLKKNQ